MQSSASLCTSDQTEGASSRGPTTTAGENKVSTRDGNRPGFTLIEVLVTLVLVGLLVAFVFPVVSQQVDEADPPRAANDLANLVVAQGFGADVGNERRLREVVRILAPRGVALLGGWNDEAEIERTTAN